jgi:hypothetical protein
MPFQRGVPRPPNAGRKKGSLNKLTIGRMEAAIAAEHPEYTTLQKLKAVATIIIDRVEHTKRYTEAEGRELEALSKVLDRIMPYEHRKLAAITVKSDVDNPPRVKADLSLLTDAELDTLEKLCLKAGAGHTGRARPEVISRQLPEPRRAATRR